MDIFSAFLLWCAGSSKDTLALCHEINTIRHKMLGAFVLITTIIAFGTSYIFSASAFDFDTYRYIFSIFWASFIFCLDRFLVSTLPVCESNGIFTYSIAPLIPRLTLAIMIGIFVGTPLELIIFKNEIARQVPVVVGQDGSSARSAALSLNNNRKIELENRIADHIKQAKRNNEFCNGLQNQKEKLEAESEFLSRKISNTIGGEDGTPKGCGPDCTGYTNKKADIDKQIGMKSAEINKCLSDVEREAKNSVYLGEQQAELNRVAKLINDQESTWETEDSARREHPSPLLQYRALSKLSESDSNARNAIYFISLLLIVFEITPIAVKYLAGPGEYELHLHQIKSAKIGETKNLELLIIDTHNKRAEYHQQLDDSSLIFFKEIKANRDNLIAKLNNSFSTAVDNFLHELEDRLHKSLPYHITEELISNITSRIRQFISLSTFGTLDENIQTPTSKSSGPDSPTGATAKSHSGDSTNQTKGEENKLESAAKKIQEKLEFTHNTLAAYGAAISGIALIISKFLEWLLNLRTVEIAVLLLVLFVGVYLIIKRRKQYRLTLSTSI